MTFSPTSHPTGTSAAPKLVRRRAGRPAGPAVPLPRTAAGPAQARTTSTPSPTSARSADTAAAPDPREQAAAVAATPVRPPASEQSDAGAPPASFADLGVPAALVDVLAGAGITAPFAIQAATVSHGLAGHDVLGRAKTGAGKTLAFCLPLVARLSAAPRRRPAAGKPRAVVLAPTRELAAQIAAVIAPLAAAAGLRQTTIYGGVGQGPQVAALSAGVDVVVACPGRLADLIGQGHADLSAVEITVLDEADHMADLGFLPVVRKLLDKTPAGGQRLLFSATLDGAIDVLVRAYMHDPQRVSIDSAASAPVRMDHHVLHVSEQAKPDVVRELAAGQARTLLFTRTKHQAKKLARQLTAAGTPAVDLQGNLSQKARERNLAAFTTGTATVLVATDIAARGIHVDDVALVVHVDPPVDHKAYLHRSGRTARAGSRGIVVTLATPDQHRDVEALLRSAGIAATRTALAGGHPLLTELTGPPAVLVLPAAPEAAPSPAPDSGRGRVRPAPVMEGAARGGSGSRRRRRR